MVLSDNDLSSGKSYKLKIVKELRKQRIRADIFQSSGLIDSVLVLVSASADLASVRKTFDDNLFETSSVAIIPFYRGIDLLKEVKWHDVIEHRLSPQDMEFRGKLSDKQELLTKVFERVDWDTYLGKNADDWKIKRPMEGLHHGKEMREVSEVNQRDIN